MPNGVSKKRGFVPTRNLTGATTFRQSLYPVSANNAAPIFPGDPVCLVGGCVQQYTTAQAANFIGVAAASYTGTNRTNAKPRTFSQPSVGPYTPANGGGMVAVFDDPNIVYTVEVATSVGASMTGQFITIELSAATALGLSRSFAAGVTAADATGNFKVIGLSPDELDALGGTGNDVEVVPVFGLFKP